MWSLLGVIQFWKSWIYFPPPSKILLLTSPISWMEVYDLIMILLLWCEIGVTGSVVSVGLCPSDVLKCRTQIMKDSNPILKPTNHQPPSQNHNHHHQNRTNSFSNKGRYDQRANKMDSPFIQVIIGLFLICWFWFVRFLWDYRWWRGLWERKGS